MHGLRQSRPLPEDRPAGDRLAAGRSDCCLLAAGIIGGLTRDAARLSAGRDRPHPLRPCPGRLARHGGLGGDRRRQPISQLVWRHPLAAVAGRAHCARRRDLRRHVPRHRLDLGPPDLGHLVGMGRAADLDADPVLPLSRLHRAGRGGARAGRRGPHGGDVRPGRGDQPADHPLFGAVVAHAPPGPDASASPEARRSRRNCCGRCR